MDMYEAVQRHNTEQEKRHIFLLGRNIGKPELCKAALVDHILGLTEGKRRVSEAT